MHRRKRRALFCYLFKKGVSILNIAINKTQLSIGQKVFMPDTEEYIKNYKWYYENQYHHYIYMISSVSVKSDLGGLVSCCMIGKIGGKEGTPKIDGFSETKKFNFYANQLVPLLNNNKEGKPLLIKFNDE